MASFEEILELDTEIVNPLFSNIDKMDTLPLLALINEQDKLIPYAVEAELPYITIAVDAIVERFRNGGRLIYIGAGTSGRLGVLDASECPPTFSTPSDMVQGYIAGGKEAAFMAIEGAEDSENDGMQLIDKIGITKNDIVCGLTASGRTPFVLAALRKARELGGYTILISTNSRNKLIDKGIDLDLMICPEVGAEVVAGSTRMKSGTAQKLILNMLTTAAMVKLGKTYKNIMIDLSATNEKLRQRAKRIVMLATECSLEKATKSLEQTNYVVKEAIKLII